MLDTLSIHYDAFEDCERVVIDYHGQRTSIGFESDEDLCVYLASSGFPEYVNTEVCAEVRRHRMADQLDFEDPVAPCSRRASEACRVVQDATAAGYMDGAGASPAALKFQDVVIGVLLGVIASLVLRGW